MVIPSLAYLRIMDSHYRVDFIGLTSYDSPNHEMEAFIARNNKHATDHSLLGDHSLGFAEIWGRSQKSIWSDMTNKDVLACHHSKFEQVLFTTVLGVKTFFVTLVNFLGLRL
jgi:hypothetical protein